MNWLVALIVWILLTWGLAYAAARAELLEQPRVVIIAYSGKRIGSFLSWLLGCFLCCSFWTGQAAACVVMAHLPVPWYTWIYGPPTAGFCAVGMVDIMAFMRRGGAPHA